MLGLALPGALVRCSTSAAPRRRLPHTLEMIRVGRSWVGVHPARANQLVRRALELRAVRALADCAIVRPEAVVGGARIDFLLEQRARGRVWLEVKSVTLAEGAAARFPDSVTLRGRRHLETLARLRAAGERAALLLVVQRSDCAFVEPADDIDPAWGAALRAALEAGVEVYALGARVGPRGIVLEGALPFRA
jgi:sugar fermentation stimulation protein A